MQYRNVLGRKERDNYNSKKYPNRKGEKKKKGFDFCYI